MKIIFWLVMFFLLLVVPLPGQASDSAEYQYLVDFSNFRLHLFKDGTELNSWEVCLPRYTPPLPIRGQVKYVIFDPTWYPGKKAKRMYLAKHEEELPDSVPPGDKRNAMGKVKVNLTFAKGSRIDPYSRVHTTNQISSIGKRQSLACVRMRHEDGITFAKTIKGKTTKLLYCAAVTKHLNILYYGVLPANEFNSNSIGVPSSKIKHQTGERIGIIYQSRQDLTEIYFEFDLNGQVVDSEEPISLGRDEIRWVGLVPDNRDLPAEYSISIIEKGEKIYTAEWQVSK